MNIFTKAIIITENIIKDKLVERLSLELKEALNNNLHIYSKNTLDFNLVLIYTNKENIKTSFNYLKNNYEIIKVLSLWSSLALDNLDLLDGDIIVPNTIINTKNEAIFLDYIVDTNYDFNKFWLILNGICLTLDNELKDENEVFNLKENFVWEIIDFDAFLIATEMKNNVFLDKWIIIKIIWKNDDFIQNWIDILEFIL